MNKEEGDDQERKRPRYLTVPQLSEAYPAFSESSLRHIIFYQDTNGFNKVIVRVGRKVLIREESFIEWIENYKGTNIVGG